MKQFTGGARPRDEFVLSLLTMVAVVCPHAASAAIFPGAGNSVSTGARQGLYLVIRDVNDAPLTQSRINQIRASETKTRQYYVANSGGAFDIQYTQIVDVPLTLNADRTRPSNWVALAENYVQNVAGINPESYHANVFDVRATTPDSDQGWSGLYWGGTNNLAVQADVNTNWGQIVVDHELGHRLGAPHAGAWRTLNDGDYTSYVWNRTAKKYEEYNSALHGHQVTSYGVNHDEYGNPFDVMGNVSHGHFTIREKRTNFNWLTTAQVPNLSTTGEGVFRIYAHDELTSVYDAGSDAYGVESAYDPNVLYGLTYTRPAERFNTTLLQFENYNQTITLEYRSGRDGVQFNLGDAILDMDAQGGTDRNNLERELEVGRSIEDVDFGMSLYRATGAGDDFLAYNPPPPSNPWDLASQWYEFTVLDTSQDLIGSYIEVGVSVVEALEAADFNVDGMLNGLDIAIFQQNWRSSTAGLNYTAKHARADMDYNGRVDVDDWTLLRAAFANQGLNLSGAPSVPEPTNAALAISAAAMFFVFVVRGERPKERENSNVR
jgi:hypothetical protein